MIEKYGERAADVVTRPTGSRARWSRRAAGRPTGLWRACLFTLAAALLSGCTDAAGYDLDYILAKVPYIGTMRTTVSYEPQTMPRLPAEGTVPVASPAGEVPGAFTQFQLDSVGAVLTNSLAATPEVLARGAALYANQCAICHGAQGEGNGPVVGAGRFPMGPAVNGAATAGRSDGYIYGVIRVGRGLMPAYGERIGHNDRWAVVHFLRDLQQRAGAVTPVGAPAGAAAPAAPGVEPTVEPAGQPAVEPAVPPEPGV